jgi:hypothetical protein
MQHAVLIVVIAATAIAAPTALKCSACSAVVDELQQILQKEMPQQDLDLRSRLDGSGKRKGKVIDWRMSELRSLEIIEGLCMGMADYTVVTSGDGVERYQKFANTDGSVHISSSMNFGGEGSREEIQKLRIICEAFVEEHEETLGKAIQETPKGLRNKFCVEVSGLCTATQLDELVTEKIAKDERPDGTHVSPGAQKWIDQDRKKREEEEEEAGEAAKSKKKKRKKKKRKKGSKKDEL